jgi:hypothetical protein
MLRPILQALLIMLALLPPANIYREDVLSTRQLDEPAYFRFDYPPYPETFVIQLTDPELIDEARAMLAGQQQPRHVMGQIVKQPAAYNPPWGYHLDSNTIQFFNSAIEVCDASIGYVEQHLVEACGAFLPGCIWCPWGSRLIEEVRPPVGETRWLYLPLITR